jgi:hypothetical protein
MKVAKRMPEMNLNKHTIDLHRKVDKVCRESSKAEMDAFNRGKSICPLCGASVNGIGTVIVERKKRILGPGTFYQYCSRCK